MKGAKLFTASLAVLALALGFFLGNFCGKSCPCCNKGEMTCCKKMEGPCPRQGMMPPPPPGGPHHPGDFDKGPGPHDGFHGGHKFKHKRDPVVIDSLLQVTPEQKAALDESRAKGDSIFKDLRKQKHEAEKALGQALESRDAASIDDAKAKVLDADKALLEHRINGMQALAKILNSEQLEKFNQFHKEQMKKFKERMKKGPAEGEKE
jgi:Spy/CpxP family protein refolding chaperone